MSDRFEDLLKNFEDNNENNDENMSYGVPVENADNADATDVADFTDVTDVADDTDFSTLNETQASPDYSSYHSFEENSGSVYVDYKKPATDYQSFDSNGVEVREQTDYSQPQYVEPQYVSSQYNQQYTNPQYTTQNPYYTQPVQSVKKKKEKTKVGIGVVAVLLVIGMFFSAIFGFLGSVLYTKIKASNAGISDNGAMIINKVDIDEETASTLADKSTSQITDEVADTVVEITTEVMSTNSFYGQYVSQGAGSGVIISTDGYIVTNNHVIDGATSITVTLRDKSTYQATLVGKDSIIDVALLKIDATGLKAANFGDSDSLKVGDKAVAIGNPLGQLGGTVTDGIISALDRDVVIDDETMSLLQTDSAINPGNSGGGLFDGQGALIGVVVAKSSGEEIEGLGFAIPINDVVDILDDLKEYGYVRGRVSAGVQLVDISNSMYSMYYYGNTNEGCYVHSVEFDSAAYKAGIQQGDRIVSVNSQEVTTSADVEKALDDAQVGDEVTFEIERGTRTAQVTVVLQEYVPQDVKAEQEQENVFNPFA